MQNSNIKQLEVLLSEKKIAEALNLLQAFAETQKNGSALNAIDEMKLIYGQMLNFALKGTSDTEREQIFMQLLYKSYALFDDLYEIYQSRNSSFFEYKQKQERKQLSIITCIENLYTLQDKIALNDLLADVFNKKDNDLESNKTQTYYFDLFYSILIVNRLTENEQTKLTDFIADENFSIDFRGVIVSALMLSTLSFFQVEKIVLLLTLCRSKDEMIRLRALVAIVFICQCYAKRIGIYKTLVHKMRKLSADSNFTSELEIVICHLIRSQETENLNRKIKEDLLPDMMRISPKLNEKWNDSKTNNIDEETSMDEMQELFDEIGLSEKLQQLGELQREGSDIYMSTFSSLKHYPFFDEAFNWFMPFNPKNESIKSLFENDNDIFSLLMSNNMMCDSDKYSFCFSLMQLPDSQMDFMKHNLKTEIEQIKTDINDRSLKDSKLTFSLKANNYIQNLYRYYKLFKHTMSYNPFLHLSELTDITFLWKWLDKKNILSIADFYFSKKMYTEALSLYTRMNPENSEDIDLLCKLAYTYQRVGELEKAVDIYTKIELSAPEKKWVLRQLAICYKKLKNIEQSLLYFQRLLDYNPEDYKLLLNIANCLFEQKKYAEALALYFKINYFNPDNLQVIRSLAWCSFLCEKLEQAERYFEKITIDKFSTIDFIRWAFIRFYQGDVDGAIELFQKAYSTDLNLFEEIFEMVSTELKNFKLQEKQLWNLREYIKLRIN